VRLGGRDRSLLEFGEKGEQLGVGHVSQFVKSGR
jgi:hypothetical protein